MQALLRQQSLYRNVDLHPSFKSTPLHYTTHSGWGGSCLNPTFLASAYELLPPMTGEFIWIILWMGYCWWLWSHVQSSEYSQVCWVLGRRHCGTQPREICQLMWPGFQSTQIQPLKQFLLPLLHSQLWHQEALCPLYHLHYTGLCRGLWYPCECNCPCH